MSESKLAENIAHPNIDNSDELLHVLGFGGLPSREQVHQEIDQKLLQPQDRLPPHWLPLYQMCDTCA
jgi:antiviral helicase SKI2